MTKRQGYPLSDTTGADTREAERTLKGGKGGDGINIIEDPSLRTFLYVAFFITGTTGLVYQVLWSRLLVLSFGYTIYSVAVVTTAFMGGLAAGSALGGIVADRVKNRVMLYAAAELGIGLIALISYPVLTGLPSFIADFRELLSIPYSGFSIWTFIIALLVLVPPTMLMGFTLPLLARAITRSKADSAVHIGNLYALNTFGAAAGSLLCGFFLVAYFGVFTTIFITAIVNILIALSAYLYIRGRGERELTAPSVNGAEGEAGPGRDEVGPKAPRSRSLLSEPLFWAFGISGFASLGCEILWIRLFTPYLENSTYAFSLILGIVLFGIASGGLAGRWMAARTKVSIYGYGLCQAFLGVFTAAAVLLFFTFIDHFHMLLPSLGLLLESGDIIIEQAKWIGLILLPSTFFMGLGFPFVAQWAGRDFKSLGKRTGKLYASNTVGSLLGVLFGGFFLLPAVGAMNGLTLLAILSLLNGMALIYTVKGSITKMQLTAAGTAAALFAVSAVPIMGNPNPAIMALESAWPNYKVIANREDPDVNVTYMEHKEYPMARTLFINLRLVSGSGRLITPWLTYLPIMLFDGEKPRVLNIGLGYGVTFTTALNHPELTIEVAELVPSVGDLFLEFNPKSEEALATGRGKIIIGDGRNYLLSAKEPYDVIMIDPTPPLYGSGAVNLYTVDFFETVRDKLTEGGMLHLRIPTSGADKESLMLVLRTLKEVFSHVSLWMPPYKGKGYSILASNKDYDVSEEELRALMEKADYLSDREKEELAGTQPKLLASEGSPLYEELSGYPVISDDRPYLEFPLFR